MQKPNNDPPRNAGEDGGHADGQGEDSGEGSLPSPDTRHGQDQHAGGGQVPAWDDDAWTDQDRPDFPPEPEFQGAGPVPEGFGFRSGMRSARTVLGFAWFVLIMATLLLLMGVIIFVGKGEWLPVVLLVLLELGFVAVFLVLAALARQRRNQR